MAMTWLLALLTLVGPAPQSRQATLPATAVARAGWLAGCWESFGKDVAPMRYAWTAASNDLMVGRSTAASAGLVPEYVFLRLESAGGVMSLVRQVAGQAPERLALDPAAASGELAFVGDSPDARQRISYRRVPRKDDQIIVSILVDGAKAVETPMKKDGCS